MDNKIYKEDSLLLDVCKMIGVNQHCTNSTFVHRGMSFLSREYDAVSLSLKRTEGWSVKVQTAGNKCFEDYSDTLDDSVAKALARHLEHITKPKIKNVIKQESSVAKKKITISHYSIADIDSVLGLSSDFVERRVSGDICGDICWFFMTDRDIECRIHFEYRDQSYNFVGPKEIKDKLFPDKHQGETNVEV